MLEECLRAVTGQRFEGRFEIIVVDDGADGDVTGLLTRRFPGVRCVRHAENRGFVAAVNTGLRAAGGEFIALINDDASPEPDWLARAARPLSDPTVASVATRIVFLADADRIDSAGDEYTVVGGAMKTGHHGPVADVPPGQREVFSACAAAALYRRRALDEVGGWDERLGAYYDDVDVGMRLRLAGYRCVYVHEAVCRHAVSASYDAASYRYHFNSSRNAELVWWSSLPRPLLYRYLLPRAAFLCLQGANKFLQSQLRPYLAGKLSAWARPDRILAMRRDRQALCRVSPARLAEAMRTRWLTECLRWRRTAASTRPSPRNADRSR